MAQRLKGQECSVLIVRDGALEAELTDVRNLEITLQFEVKSEGYLGEKTNRKDDIFNGVKGSLELHLHSQDFIPFVQAVQDRTKRNTPDVVFNISGVFAFPNGDTPTLLLPDVKFGEMPLNVPQRGDYVSLKLDFEAEDWTPTVS